MQIFISSNVIILKRARQKREKNSTVRQCLSTQTVLASAGAHTSTSQQKVFLSKSFFAGVIHMAHNHYKPMTIIIHSGNSRIGPVSRCALSEWECVERMHIKNCEWPIRWNESNAKDCHSQNMAVKAIRFFLPSKMGLDSIFIEKLIKIRKKKLPLPNNFSLSRSEVFLPCLFFRCVNEIDDKK